MVQICCLPMYSKFHFPFSKTGGPVKQLTLTAGIVMLGYLAHLAALAKGRDGDRFVKVDQWMMWRKENPSEDDLKALEILKELRSI